ncbi:MAG TPA: HD domain-containing protein [Methylomirabilota bacterium]|jgi:predicted HD phosphohydrolase|nr:HD domain-containing protein [Methylomirabilota bacterium]
MTAQQLIDTLARASARVYEPGAEVVSQLDHALQCADLAETAGADEELVLAALLHDVGRFAADLALIADRTRGAAPAAGARGHHDVGADLIAPWVTERTAWCVRMHADAKRYLCATDASYHALLSPASQRTLVMQGGVMAPDEVAAFAAHPWVADAMALRRWDDQAKVAGKPVTSLAERGALIRRWFDRPPRA